PKPRQAQPSHSTASEGHTCSAKDRSIACPRCRQNRGAAGKPRQSWATRARRSATLEGGMLMNAPNKEFAFAGSLEDLKAKERLVVHGRHRPILVIYDRGRVFALDNRCPHMG